jgi:hypothetical protein
MGGVINILLGQGQGKGRDRDFPCFLKSRQIYLAMQTKKKNC